jgi:hypothetical protein
MAYKLHGSAVELLTDYSETSLEAVNDWRLCSTVRTHHSRIWPWLIVIVITNIDCRLLPATSAAESKKKQTSEAKTACFILQTPLRQCALETDKQTKMIGYQEKKKKYIVHPNSIFASSINFIAKRTEIFRHLEQVVLHITDLNYHSSCDVQVRSSVCYLAPVKSSSRQ